MLCWMSTGRNNGLKTHTWYVMHVWYILSIRNAWMKGSSVVQGMHVPDHTWTLPRGLNGKIHTKSPQQPFFALACSRRLLLLTNSLYCVLYSVVLLASIVQIFTYRKMYTWHLATTIVVQHVVGGGVCGKPRSWRQEILVAQRVGYRKAESWHSRQYRVRRGMYTEK